MFARAKTALDPQHNRRGQVISADAAVIGAGIGGLTAAAMLARQGYKVAVLERDVHPGGCAAGFSKDGYRFAVGATVAMGFEPGGLHQRIYKLLGQKPRYVNVDPAIRVHLPEHPERGEVTVNIATERQAWQAEVARAFPSDTVRETAAKQAFWRKTAALAKGLGYAAKRFPVMPFKHLYDVLDTAKAAHPSLLPVFANLHRSVADLLTDIDDSYHRAFIDGQLLDAMQTTADNCVAPNGALALDIYRAGCQYKIGGLETIAQDLADYVTAQGGVVLYSTLAKEIATDGRRVCGVATNRANIDAPVVISAIPLANTANLLPTETPSDLPKRADAQPEMWGAFTLYMGVDERALPADVHFYEQVTDLDTHQAAGNCLISISPAWDRQRAPEGKRAITVSTHVEAARWLDIAHDKEAYQHEKHAFERLLLRQVERALPNIRDGIEVFLSGTPKTFRGFTRRVGGTVGGIPQTRQAANFAAPSHRSDIGGLFLAGDTVFPGQGTLGVTVSGYNAARSAGRYLNRTTAKRARARPLTQQDDTNPTRAPRQDDRIVTSSAELVTSQNTPQPQDTSHSKEIPV